MNRAKRNERKLEILKIVAENSPITPRELSEISHLEVHNARNLLRKYHRQGLLSRVGRDELGARLYEITDKGVDRIDWLKRRVPHGRTLT